MQEEVFDINSKEDDVSLDSARITRCEELEVLLGPEVFSRIILLEDKSKDFLDPMIFFDEGSVRRYWFIVFTTSPMTVLVTPTVETI